MSFWEQWRMTASRDPGDGSEWIVRREESFQAEEIVKMQVDMLERCHIPGFVPFRLESTDGRIAFRYRVEGLRPLSTALHSGEVAAERANGLLDALAASLSEGERYLIDPSEVALHPDWIWVSRGDVRNVRLMAVPCRGFASPMAAWRQWDALYGALRRNGLPEHWREPLDPARWEAGTFSHRLWMAELEQDRLSAASRGPDERTGESVDDKYSYTPIDCAHIDARTEVSTGDGVTASLPSDGVRKGEFVSLGIAVAGWGCFAWKPSIALFVLATLGSLPLALALRRRRRKDGEAHLSSGDEALPFASVSDASDVVSSGPLAERTILLGGPDETMLLSDIANATAARAKLVIRFDDAERIEIADVGREPIRFGRGPTNVDIRIEHAAASRLHLTVERSEDDFFASDAGSTNGSYLNDVPMSPDEKYPLRHNDELRLPGASIRFERDGG